MCCTIYNLPQTVGTDKRDWADTNQAFADVDAALYTASETASTAASNISTLDNQINGEGGIDARLTTAENDIDNVEGAVSTLQNTVSGHTTAIADVRTDCEDMIVAVEITAAQMEDSPVAIPTGSYFRYNDVLYKATSDIAIHDVIVPNTNCEATNVATELVGINTALSSETAYEAVTLTPGGGHITITHSNCYKHGKLVHIEFLASSDQAETNDTVWVVVSENARPNSSFRGGLLSIGGNASVCLVTTGTNGYIKQDAGATINANTLVSFMIEYYTA